MATLADAVPLLGASRSDSSDEWEEWEKDMGHTIQISRPHLIERRHPSSLPVPEPSVASFDDARRGPTFRFLWTGAGLFIVAAAGFIVINAVGWPWLFAGDGRDIPRVIARVCRRQALFFWVGSATCGVMAGAAAVMLFLLFARRDTVVPKTAAELLASFVGGLSPGAIMVSYTTRQENAPDSHMYYGPAVPRAVARLFPCRWLDQDALLPGIPLLPACLQAANDCLFGIIFVCEAYLQSPVCLAEFQALSTKRNLIFVYPDALPLLDGSTRTDAPREQLNVLLQLRQLRSQPKGDGPSLFILTRDDVAVMAANPAYFVLQACLAADTFKWLFHLHTPFIFQRWRATAYMLSGKCNTSWRAGPILLVTWIVPLALCAFGVFYSDRATIVGVSVAYCAVLVGVTAVLRAMFSGLVGTVRQAHHLVEPASLLIVLHRLGIVPQVAINTGGLHAAKFQALAGFGAVSLDPLSHERHLAFIDARCILSRTLIPAQYEPQPGGLYPAVWCDSDFAAFHLLPASINQSWIHKTESPAGLDYLTMCSLILLFALEHQCLMGNISGIHLRPPTTSGADRNLGAKSSLGRVSAMCGMC